MKFETFIARRYLSSKNKPLFLSLLTGVSLAGMSVAVFSLIFVLSIMEGFEEDFQKRIIGFEAPLILRGPPSSDWSSVQERIQKNYPEVGETSLFIEGEAVLQSDEGEAMGIRLRGVSPDLKKDRFGALDQGVLQAKTIFLGQELAYGLRVHPDFGDSVELLFPFGEVSPTGEVLPIVRRYKVQGTFRTGFYEYDSKSVLVTLEEARFLLGDAARTGLEVWPRAPLDASSLKRRLTETLKDPSLKLETWEERNPKLFAALKLERIGMFLLLLMLMLLASFSIFGLTSLLVMEKVREMALLRTLGLTPLRIRKIFLSKAAMIGLVGDLLGGGLSLLLISFFIRYPLRLPTTYYVEFLPLHFDWGNLLLVLLLSPLVALLAALYPAWQSIHYSPIQVLQHE